ncbi:MAG: hypothetical protein JWP35_2570 [Caulobacter sp.]|nr:hypothetical protein [Caulobacter sp.]
MNRFASYRIDAPAPRLPGYDMIDAIVRFADQRTDMGSGRVLLRLSAGRRAQAEVMLALGHDLRRAGEIGVVWDERDEEVVRIVDDARLKPAAHSWWEDYFDRFDNGEEEQQRRAA